MNPKLTLIPCLLLALTACKPGADAEAPASQVSAPQAAAPTAAATPPAAIEVAAPDMPSLKIATLDGTPYDLASKRGGWVVVNFWATWCAPCIKEMPELDAFDAEYNNVQVIGLAYEEIAVDDMRAFLKKRPVSYPVAIVDTYEPPADFPTPRGLPMTYIIAPDGKIAKEFMGPVTKADLAAVIDSKG